MKRILLSVPHMGLHEQAFVREAFDTNWLSTVGPHIEAFEKEFSAKVGGHRPAVALASGTAALHLGFRLLNVGPGDEVFCQDLTFIASVNPILYLGAKPVFIDSDRTSWNMDPQRLSDAFERRVQSRRPLPKAVVVVHLYGQSADMDAILEVSSRYEVPVFEDAAEAVGTTYRGRPAGTSAPLGAFSFNGNKIITTTGGGMLVSHHPDWIAKARYWSTQAREPGLAYHHIEVGHNYRLSNLLAGIGRGQLMVLDERVRQRRAVFQRYQEGLGDLPGLTFAPDAGFGVHTRWLSCVLVDGGKLGVDRDGLIKALDEADIESRPVWKPMHLQPLFAGCETVGTEVSAELFRRGLCLPSSSSLGLSEQQHVIDTIRRAARPVSG